MKMNTIKFAELTSWITKITGVVLQFDDICTIQNIIDEGVTPEALPTDVSKQFVGERLNIIFTMINNKQKIEAIKAVREITSWGLKESKDWVEAWPSKPVNI